MKRTPLYPIYQNYQAKVIDFHGWELPVQFSGIIQEHLTVRKQVGLFDVSHMGEIMIEGPQATAFLNYILTNQISTLKPGFIRYSPLCFEDGGTIDDLLVYCFQNDKYLLVVNASNIETDFSWLQKMSSPFQVTIKNISEQTAQFAIQGPLALDLLSRLMQLPIATLRYYQFFPEAHLNNIPVLISRTGYTGEDGFEIYLEPDLAIETWELIMKAGTPMGIKPIGLGARDTLRFEASLPLYGNELTDKITPLEAGLSRFVKLEKPDFIGRKSLLKQQTAGIPRTLVGLEMIERGIPRSECLIYKESQQIGHVTSGNYCPHLQKNMALGLINYQFGILNSEVQVEIRGKLVTAKIVKLPFYSPSKGETK